MFRKSHFIINEKVSGTSLDGRLIIGIYRGVRSSFGAIIFGKPINSIETSKNWTVTTLTLTPLERALPKFVSLKKKRLKPGEPCRGATKEGLQITGIFQNTHNKNYQWILGWAKGESRLGPKKAYKVLRSSVRRLDNLPA